MRLNDISAELVRPQVEPQPKVQPPETNSDKNRSAQVFDSKAGDLAFQSSVMKEAVLKAYAKVGGDPEPPKAVDYFEIDKQADEIIKKHTSGNLFGSNLDTDAVGKELAGIAKTDPAKARALADNILDKISTSDKDEVAQSLVDSLTPAQLRELAKDPNGRAMLEQLKGELLTGSVWDDEKATAERINTAIKTAELEQTPEFQKLSPQTQDEIRSQLAKNEKNGKAVDNLIGLVKSSGFDKLPAETQKAMLQALAKRPEDTIFREALGNLASNGNFTGLNGAQQSQVITDLDKFANTESYKGSDGFLFFGGHHVSDDDKKALLTRIGDVSIYSAAHPDRTIVRNSLDQLTSGRIKVELYEKKPDSTIEYGYADGNTIHLNKLTIGNTDKLVETLSHEVNHIVNGSSEYNQPERFVDEYRAFITGFESLTGKELSAQKLKDILDNLGHSSDSAYPNLRKLYLENDKFRKVIDEVYAGLDKNPPVKTSAEELRQKLLDAGFDSDYLRNPGNTDNH